MLTEYITNELAIYTLQPREVVDDYTLVKANKDRKKLLVWLTLLMQEHDVIIFYMDDDGLEKFIIGTLKDADPRYLNTPTSTETTNRGTVEALHHIAFLTHPGRQHQYLHLDHITRFIVKNDKITEISRKL
jgi:hypothetical protein